MSRMNRRFELRDRRVRVARVRRCAAGARVPRLRPFSPTCDPMRLDPVKRIAGRASDERPIAGQQPKPNEPLRSRVGVLSFERPVVKSEMKAT